MAFVSNECIPSLCVIVGIYGVLEHINVNLPCISYALTSQQKVFSAFRLLFAYYTSWIDIVLIKSSSVGLKGVRSSKKFCLMEAALTSLKVGFTEVRTWWGLRGSRSRFRYLRDGLVEADSNCFLCQKTQMASSISVFQASACGGFVMISTALLSPYFERVWSTLTNQLLEFLFLILNCLMARSFSMPSFLAMPASKMSPCLSILACMGISPSR